MNWQRRFNNNNAVKNPGIRGFPKTSVFGKVALNLREKTALLPLFPKPFPKPTGFWEWLIIQDQQWVP
jgi:hypothetical protein